MEPVPHWTYNQYLTGHGKVLHWTWDHEANITGQVTSTSLDIEPARHSKWDQNVLYMKPICHSTWGLYCTGHGTSTSLDMEPVRTGLGTGISLLFTTYFVLYTGRAYQMLPLAVRDKSDRRQGVRYR